MKMYDDFDGTFEEYSNFLEEERAKEIAYLDTLDILPLLAKGIDLDDLIYGIHRHYDEDYEGGDMFDALDETDIMNYISDRFHIEFDCHVYVKYILHDDVQKGTRYDKNPVPDVPEME